MAIKKLLVINVPIKYCNLNCNYCYISALRENKPGPAVFEYSPEHVGKCLSKERMGGTCLINLTGGGETLIPKEMPQYIYHLLAQGHYLEVVTNGTLSERFNEIVSFPPEYLNRLEFKFSFHYHELSKKKVLEVFFDNIKMIRKAGCSFTVELMPHDEIINDIDQIIDICEKKIGAACQVTVGRNDLIRSKGLLTNKTKEEYYRIWQTFNSEMFDYKMHIFGKKVNKFCYAGCWSLYIDLGTGDTKPCYGQLCNQNIFEEINRPIILEPVGIKCRQPYCYNGHAFLTLGVVPDLKSPCYSDIRNRSCIDGSEWLKSDVKDFFSHKLNQSNKEWTLTRKLFYEMFYPLRLFKNLLYDKKGVKRYLNRVMKNDDYK